MGSPVLAMSPAASWALLLGLCAIPVAVVGGWWRRDRRWARRQRELDARIARRYRQP